MVSQDSHDLSHTLVGLGAVESSYLLRSAPGIDNPRDPDLAPLKLYFQYLAQLEVRIHR